MIEHPVANPNEEEAPDTPAAAAATAQSRGGGMRTTVSPSQARRRKSKARIKFGLGPRILRPSPTPRYERKPDDPIYRPLKIYTIDPSRRRDEGQSAEINIPFEGLENGPKGMRFRVVKSGMWPLRPYTSVDLNEDSVLMTGGRDPAPTDPVFHHQMVYAVAMSTYSVFRTALGREVSWGFRNARLKLVPHAFENANAQYIRDRERLEFGWYRVEANDKIDMPEGTIIFSCLSHDIIVHELTHALLDGLRVRFDRATNPDVGAFHEAFADLVALLQRFSYREVVRDIIVSTHADLRNEGDWLRLVLELARGKGDPALRVIDLEGKQRYDPSLPEHDLGTILVSAIIDAFVTIYTRKAAPLIRLATGGKTAVPADQALSDDLLSQLTRVASRVAGQLLTMCIRAIDYCPPVDITFGEYLRALVTADRDLVPDDPWSYREAMVDAFRKRRIFPYGIPSLTEDALLWDRPPKQIVMPELNFGVLRWSGDPAGAAKGTEVARQARLVGELVCRRENLDLFGLADPGDPEFGCDRVENPVVESVRISRRVGPDGQLAFDLIAEIIQRRHVGGGEGYPPFVFRAGATVVFGAEGEVRFVISKNIKSKVRFKKQRDFAVSAGADVYALRSCRHQLVADPPAASPATHEPLQADS